MSDNPLGIYAKYVAAVDVLSKRKVINDFPQQLGELFLETFNVMQEKKLDPAGAPMTIYYDKEFNPAAVDVEVCWPVRLKEQSTNTLPEILAASCLHVGPYTELCTVYEGIFKWIAENGYVPAGPMREISHNCPQITQPEKLVSEILVPIAKK